jgi:hypothetical protein
LEAIPFQGGSVTKEDYSVPRGGRPATPSRPYDGVDHYNQPEDRKFTTESRDHFQDQVILTSISTSSFPFLFQCLTIAQPYIVVVYGAACVE